MTGMTQTRQMVADREDAQCLYVRLSGQRVEGSRLHLDGEDAVAAQAVVIHIVVVEAVSGEDVADRHGLIQFAGLGNGRLQQMIVGQRCVVDDRAEDAPHDGGVRRRALGDEHVAQMHVLVHAAAGADADQFLAAELMDELVDVDGDGRNAHARALDGDGDAFVRARVAKDVAYARVELRVLQKVLSDEFCAQRIARQENALGDIAFFCPNMRSCHV